MTRFNHTQLQQLYGYFGLAGLAVDVDGRIPIYTEYVNQNGVPCCYQIHLEELFLFTMTKLSTGLSNMMLCDTNFGGSYTHWSFGYPWAIMYLNKRYKNIIAHQGLCRYASNFPRFNQAIQWYVRKEHICMSLLMAHLHLSQVLIFCHECVWIY